MTEPTISDDPAKPAVGEPKIRFRFRSGRRRSAERVVEESSVVVRPSTVIFQASPTTIAASLAKAAADPGEAVIVWGPGAPAAGHTAAGVGTATAPPAFIVGSGPAERERLRLALGSHENLRSAPESDLLAELAKSVHDNQESLAHLGYPEQYWYKAAAEGFASREAQRAAAEAKGRWVAPVDTTGLPLDTLDRMFPTARIIHVVDGAPRFSRKTIRSQAGRLSAGRYLEIHSRDLDADPHAATRAVLDFLGEHPGSTPMDPLA